MLGAIHWQLPPDDLSDLLWFHLVSQTGELTDLGFHFHWLELLYLFVAAAAAAAAVAAAGSPLSQYLFDRGSGGIWTGWHTPPLL